MANQTFLTPSQDAKLSNTIFLNILLALLYIGSGKLSFYASVEFGNVTSVFFPPEGIALAFLILFGYRVAFGVIVGQALLSFWADASTIGGLFIGVFNALEVMIGAYLYHKYQISNRLDRPRDVIIFVAIIFLVLQPFSATMGVAILYLVSVVPSEYFGFLASLWLPDGTPKPIENISGIFSAWSNWWIGNSLGQLIFAPLIIAWVGTKGKFEEIKPIDLLILIATSIAIYILVQLDFKQSSVLIFTFSYPLFLWIGSRLGIRSITLMNLAIASIIVYINLIDSSLMSNLDTADKLFYSSIAIASLSFSSLLIYGLLAERNNFIDQLQVEIKNKDEAESRFRAIADATFESILIHKDSRVLDANSRALAMFGYQYDEMIGKNPEDLFDSTSAKKVREKIKEGALQEYEVAAKDSSGKEFIVEIRARSATYKNMQVRVASLRDVTTQKEAEKLLKESNSELQKRVDIELQKRLDQERMLIQQSKMATAGEMLQALTHQWKQPITVLNLILQTIQDSINSDNINTKEILEDTNHGLDQIQFMINTNDDFLAFLKPDRERIKFCPDTAIEAVVKLFEKQFRSRGIELEIASDDRVMIFGFENEFKQAILSILTNAKEALIENRKIGAKIKIDIHSNNEIVEISFLDNGGGICNTVLPSIFEAHKTTKTNGSGIGLYITYKIIESMGGTIEARNENGGAKFVIKLSTAPKSDKIDT